ncbi:MAG: hypothetical protein EPO35_08395 [Acidobacteria bacterium]|nr:MAG: hypothetical protein EPO35_08395 [Acidobacteriota bacterium]
MQPDPLQRFFARAGARLRVVAGFRGVALALAAGVPLLSLRWLGTLSWPELASAMGVAAVVVAAIMIWVSPRRADRIAAEVESRTPAPKNVLITAAEIQTTATPLRDDVRAVVFRDAADAAARVDLPAIFPLRRTLAWMLSLAAVWAIGLSIDGRTVARARARLTGSAITPEISRLAVTVTPPPYTGRPAHVLVDPERIDVLAGSTLHLVVEGSAAEIELTAAGAHRRLVAAGGTFSGDVTAADDGFVALQPFGAGDVAGIRRVVPVAVTLDHAPVARIVEPGKDLFLAKPDRTLPVKIEATDDIGLTSLRLTFTKVTGSGENFTFTTGEFPVQITRRPVAGAPDAWSAVSTLPLPTLRLEPGDLLVYRALVADGRPGATPVESDAFVIQILMPGEALAEGFTIDEDHDRYAISQQMIIIKTERLIANQAKLSAEDFQDQAHTLAAEQRKVRAEFVFMMGGEFEDATTATGDINEEEEAANEAELLAGRMQNNGRRDIITATRYMSRAAQRLTDLQPGAALPDEKSALVSLQRAFVRSRYILRVLTARERIDDARRLSGKLEAASDWRRPSPSATDDPKLRALLAALAGVSRLTGVRRYTAAEADQLAATAESLLRLDPGLSPVAEAFSRAAAAIADGRSAGDVSALVNTAAVALSAAARAGAPGAPATADPSASRLHGALADLMRRAGGRR